MAQDPEKRRKCLELDVCYKHPERKTQSGKMSCAECCESERLRSKRRYNSAKTGNYCQKHKGRPPVPGHVNCQECLDKLKFRNKQKAEQNKKSGRCVYHSEREVDGGSTLCEECLDARNGVHHERKAAKLCVKHITRPATIGLFCEECWYKNISIKAFGTVSNWPLLKALLAGQHFKCAYTGIVLIPGKNASVDHLIPTSLGGFKVIENVHWTDLKVNWSKRDISDKDFLTITSLISSNQKIIDRWSEFVKPLKSTPKQLLNSATPIKAPSECCVTHRTRKIFCGRHCEECWFNQQAFNNLRVWGEGYKLRDLFHRQEARCVYTGVILTLGQNAAIDHIVPRAQNGPNVLSNLQWIDVDVNKIKYDRNHAEFLEFCNQVTSYQKGKK